MSQNKMIENKNWYESIPKHLIPKYHNPYFSEHGISVPARIILVGSSGSGKTQNILDLIAKMRDTFQMIVVCCKNSDEPLYNYLKTKIEPDQLVFYEDGKIPTVKEFDVMEGQVLMIFDDLVNLKCQDKIFEHFLRGRKGANNHGISYVYSTQSYFNVPKRIRSQSTHIFLKKISGDRDLKAILQDYTLGMDAKSVVQLYKYATQRQNSFFMIDLNAPEEQKFRRNFAEVISFGVN